MRRMLNSPRVRFVSSTMPKSIVHPALVFSGLAALLTSCIGVSEKKLNPDGSLAPLRYCPTGSIVPAGGLIDDMEDANTRTDQVEGRGGYWWKSADPTGSVVGPDDITPTPPPGEKGNAMHFFGETTAGQGDDYWGVQFGANFAPQDGYDASKYVGVRFRAKVAHGSSPDVRFKISDVNTHPNFGVCTACWNHFGADLSLTEEWHEYEFFFGTLSQAPYWGSPRPSSITPAKLFAFDFQVSSGKKFDVWIDDIAFIACK